MAGVGTFLMEPNSILLVDWHAFFTPGSYLFCNKYSSID